MKSRFLALGMAALLSFTLILCACRSRSKTGETVRDMKITVLVDNLGDLSYNDGIVRELRLAETRYDGSKEINLSVNVFEMQPGTGKEKDELELAFREDSELIIIANQLALPFLEPAAAYYPEKNFILLDMEATGSNIHAALFKPNEAAYLCGALAAKMSDTGVIGIVIGMNLTVLHDFAVGYIQGALAANPDCKIIISTVGNFYDADAGYELAAKQFEQGVDVCFSAAGGAGLGCIKAAHDLGFYSIGVDVDQTEQVEPELRNRILTSCLKNFDSLIAVLLDNYITGTLKFGESGHFGIKEGAVGIVRNQYYRSAVPQNIQREIDEMEEKVSSGAVHVRSAFEMTQTEIDALFRSVRP